MEKKSIGEVQEYSGEKFTKRVLFQEGGSVVFVLNFMPGQALPPHKHPGSSVFLQVLNGGGTLIVNESRTELTAGDVVSTDGGDQFSFENTTSSNTSLFVVLNKLPDERYAQNV